jgi:tetratricopeptide (TPR) repeat protein
LAVLEGKYALIKIYAEEKDWRQVLAWYDSVKTVTPDDPFSLWQVVVAQINLKDFEGARQTLFRLLQIEKSSIYFDIASEMEIRYWLALIDYYQKDYKKALSGIGFAFANKKAAEDNDYAKNTLDWAKELKEKIDKELGIR